MAKVLVVEDNESDRLLLRTILNQAGHEIFFAREGEEAYKAYIRRGVQVIVTDLQMPNVDGLELIEELLSVFPDAPIIAVSGRAREHLKTAKLMGAHSVLPKPIDRDALLAAVADAAGQPGAQRDF